MREYRVTIGEKSRTVLLLEKSADTISFEIAGEKFSVKIAPGENYQSASLSVARPAPSSVSPSSSLTSKVFDGTVRAPMPGFIAAVKVSDGDQVSVGSPLLTIEAMKMENSITAPRGGKIKKVHVRPGDEVLSDASLITIE